MAFIEEVLQELGLPHKFIAWIMTCVSFVSYSIINNGVPTKPFKARMGLRQGDPMSPFLFADAMEYFSRVLHQMKGQDIKFHPKNIID